MQNSETYVKDIDKRVEEGLTKCFLTREEAIAEAKETGSYVYELRNNSGQVGKWAVPK